ncbi:MAG: DMT family transporter [Lachnospiraceae bacterium]|nr:DMT family transporter [Lachnospiraceae bacterium]
MKMGRMKNNLLLILTALIWGCAFVAQSVGMDYVGPFTFNTVRYIIGALVLIPVIRFVDHMEEKNGETPEQRQARIGDKKTLVRGGICCGLALAVASSLQQWGLLFTTVGKAGFITAMYIVLVPILSVFLRKKLQLLIVPCVALAVAGLYLLCMTEGFYLNIGDVFVIACAFVFSIHIMVIDHFSPLVDGVRMSAIQFLTAAIVCAVPTLMWETATLDQVPAAWKPILYAGVMSCGVAYTLQIVAQKNADPTVASLLMSLESVFSVLAGWVLLGQALSLRELLGCVLMFAAIVLAQLPEKKAA